MQTLVYGSFLEQYIRVRVRTHACICVHITYVIFGTSLWMIFTANHWVFPEPILYNNWLQKGKRMRQSKNEYWTILCEGKIPEQ